MTSPSVDDVSRCPVIACSEVMKAISPRTDRRTSFYQARQISFARDVPRLQLISDTPVDLGISRVINDFSKTQLLSPLKNLRDRVCVLGGQLKSCVQILKISFWADRSWGEEGVRIIRIIFRMTNMDRSGLPESLCLGLSDAFTIKSLMLRFISA